MSAWDERKQFLIGAAIGYTGWIAERTPNAFAFLYMAVLGLFPASLAYARRLVTTTVLLTLALALLAEGFTVGSEAFWHVLSSAAR